MLVVGSDLFTASVVKCRSLGCEAYGLIETCALWHYNVESTGNLILVDFGGALKNFGQEDVCCGK
jgi:hypothetical protein